MTGVHVEIILQGAKEKYPETRPRIISDNGPQFNAKDFPWGMTHVHTSPFLPAASKPLDVQWRPVAPCCG